MDAKTGTISTIAGDGYFGHGGDGGTATMAELYGPQGISLDAKGDLYFGDVDNSRVREVIFTASAVPPTITSTPSASSIATAQALTVTVAVNGGNTSPTPTGSVTLSASRRPQGVHHSRRSNQLSYAEGLLKWDEAFLDGSFAPAKRARRSGKRSAARERSGYSQGFRWRFGWKVRLQGSYACGRQARRIPRAQARGGA